MILLAKVGIGLGTTMLVAASWIFHEGVIRVDVDEAKRDGEHVHLWVPATAVSAGLQLAPRHCLEHAAQQSREFLPALRQMAKELKKYPDAELVNVHNRSENVSVSVRNGRLYIDVVTDGNNVHVSFPAEALRDVADRLEDVAHGT